jgi:hypothetical protein
LSETKNSGRGGLWALQPQIVLEQVHGFWSERQKADFLAFAPYANLRFRKQQIAAIQIQHLFGAQSLEQHQSHNGQVTRGTETGPEACDLVHR